MILPLHDRLRAHVARLLVTLYSLDDSTLPAVVIEYPPNRDLGDLGTPVAFELARRLRKAPLGDTLVRVLRFRSIPVEVQNYIDDTGVQVADVVVGFRVLEGKNLAQIREIAETTRFDYYCWDLYARVTEWYEEDKERLKIRTAALHAIEHGGNDTADMAAFIADRIVRCHLDTMRRMNIGYDLLTWEGDILRRHFWAHAFEFLKKTGEVYLQTEGKLAGCWVMKIDDEDAEASDPLAKDAGEGDRPA